LSIVSVVSWLPVPSQPTAQAAGDCTVTASDVAIDADEQALLNGINAYRAQNGAGPLAFSPTLNKAAAWMSRDMATHDYFSHFDRSGRSPGTRMTDCGYTNIYTWRGENLAAGQWTPDAALAAWKGSAGHNALMLDPKYVAVGIGKAYDATSPYKTYWTLDAASWLDASVPNVTPASPTALPPTRTRTPTGVPAVATATRTNVPAPPTNTPLPTSAPPASPTRTSTAIPTQPGAVLGGGERLTNPGFEGGVSGWDRPSWFASVANTQESTVHSGEQGFRFQGKSSGPYVQQSVAATGGQTVNFSGWVNVPTRGRGMSGQIELQALNSRNGTLGTYSVHSFTSTTPGWVQVSKSQKLPAGTASVRVKVRFTTLDGTVYVDDLSLR
jgi:uncharacterized protein YkwD